MKNFTESDLKSLSVKQALLVAAIGTIASKVKGDVREGWEDDLKRVQALYDDVKAIVEDPQFSTAIPRPGISYPRPGSYSSAQTQINAVMAARELVQYIQALLAVSSPPNSQASNQEQAAELDSRLKIFRREVFDRDLVLIANGALASSSPASLVMLDVDRFKSINDQHGHPVGDEVLEAIAKLVRQAVGDKGRCYRYGGEEFSVLLTNYSAEEAAALAERLRDLIERTRLSSKQLAVTASFGIGTLPDHAHDAKELVDKADAALYESKKLGRNLVRVSGEPPPPSEAPRTPARRQPDPSGLSDDEAEAIRLSYFSSREARCPRDGAVLSVHESHAHNRKTPTLMLACPLCGLRASIAGPN